MEAIRIHNPFSGAGCFLLRETGSTMDEARRLLRLGYPLGTLVAADLQTAGRGRLSGRAWESEAGKNLLFTLCLERENGAPAGLPLRVGAAMCRTLSLLTRRLGLELPAPPRIKWPNDLFLGGRKAAGVLCEAAPEAVYVGIGLNCNQTSFPGRLDSRATSLALELGREVDRWEVLGIFLDTLAQALHEDDWRAAAEEFLWRRGEEVVFIPGLPGLEQAVRGRLVGLDGTGALLLRLADQLEDRAYVAGELLACDSPAMPASPGELTRKAPSYKVRA